MVSQTERVHKPAEGTSGEVDLLKFKPTELQSDGSDSKTIEILMRNAKNETVIRESPNSKKTNPPFLGTPHSKDGLQKSLDLPGT